MIETQTQLDEWIEQFHSDGYLCIPSVLPTDMVTELRTDLERILDETGGDFCMRMFERSQAAARLFAFDPIAAFAERIIGDAYGPEGAENVHVIHNNAFRTKPFESQLTAWHPDDPPHYLVTDGNPPTNVRLPVLFFTANYYLTDVTEVEHGGTVVVPGSHLRGAYAPATLEGETGVPCLGPAGTVAIFNNQVWHRGGPNTSDQTRYIVQVTYARRVIGHRYHPYMNYTMPEHVYADADPRLRRLLGFLPVGAYG